MLLERSDDLVCRQAELTGGRLDDPKIRLMGNQPVEIRTDRTIRRQRFVADLFQRAHCEPEYGLPVHAKESVIVQHAVLHVPRGREDMALSTVRVQVAGKNTGLG